jgi:hypothetical protein
VPTEEKEKHKGYERSRRCIGRIKPAVKTASSETTSSPNGEPAALGVGMGAHITSHQPAPTGGKGGWMINKGPGEQI